MKTVNQMIYTTLASAKKGAQRANIPNPTFSKNAEGKIVVHMATDKPSARRSTVSKIGSPVDAFRKIFDAHYGKLRRSEVIDKAVEAGVAKNTAATYYQKLRTAS